MKQIYIPLYAADNEATTEVWYTTFTTYMDNEAYTTTTTTTFPEAITETKIKSR